MRVAVCDYGAGNVRSVLAAFRRLGAEPWATRDPDDVLEADLAVLPGVGSAASAMEGLRGAGLDEALRARVSAGKADAGDLPRAPARARGERGGRRHHLGSGSSRAVPPACATDACPGSAGRASSRGATPIYFAHSFAAETPAATAMSEGVVAAAASGSFVGVQFHPEKSGPAGARFLDEQLTLCLSRA